MIGEQPSARTKITLVKIKGGMTCELVCLGEEPLGFRVHWLSTRSFMCPGVDCVACYAGLGSRWVGMMPVRWSSRQSEGVHVGILEGTASTFERSAGLLRMHGYDSHLGVRCIASRTRDRGCLRLEPFEPDEEGWREVKEFPAWLLLDAMATLYGLPSCPEGLDRGDWECTAIPQAGRMIRCAVPKAMA